MKKVPAVKIGRLISFSISLVMCLSLFSAPSIATSSQVAVKIHSPGGSITNVLFTRDTGYPTTDSKNRMLVPINAVGEAMCLAFSYDRAASSISITGVLASGASQTVTFVTGSATHTIKSNGSTHTRTMDTIAAIYGELAYVPIRYLAEAFGYVVSWDNVTQTVLLSKSNTGVFALFFEPNNGKAATVSVVKAGDAITGDRPTRYGYDFVGWYTDKACIQPLAKGAVANDDTKLYAGWVQWDIARHKLMDSYLAEMKLAKYITARGAAYESEGFTRYNDTVYRTYLFSERMGTTPITDKTVEALRTLRGNLKLVVSSPEDISWYLWDQNNMPAEDEAKAYDYHFAFDNAGYRPLLVPYLLENQKNVKGNIIIIAGGAFYMRSNNVEGYPIARYFNFIGYNSYVLQRRVAPSKPVDAYIDLQRSIRYIKHHAKALGIAKTENMIAAGFSGGGGTILGAVNDFYGDVLPTVEYPKYRPDAVDMVNSDLSAMILAYTGRFGKDGKVLGTLDTKNNRIPNAFIMVGADDSAGILDASLGLFSSLNGMKVNRVEMHAFPDTPHGYGLGQGITGRMEGNTSAYQWLELVKTFLDIEFGYKSANFPVKVQNY